MADCLFIGGIADGEVMWVDDGVEEFSVKTQHPEWWLHNLKYNNKPIPDENEDIYVPKIIFVGDENVTFYCYQFTTDKDVLSILTTNYVPYKM